MARPHGSRNFAYEHKKTEILRKLDPVVFSAGPNRPSFRDLAHFADVHPNTLRHYFGDRAGVIAALLSLVEQEGEENGARVRSLSRLPPVQGLPLLVRWIVDAWDDNLHGLHGGSLAEGLGDRVVGPAYVRHILEPSLRAVETLLHSYVERGLFPPMDVRLAALTLLSPVMFMLLHQRTLGGDVLRPLDLDRATAHHIARWCAGWTQVEENIIPIFALTEAEGQAT